MGYKLCTAEKPSVASDIASAIGAHKRQDGYFEGNGYIVTWAFGHLVGLAEPEEYGFAEHSSIWSKEDPNAKEKALYELPLLPSQFKLVVIENSRKQFNIIKTLMQRDDVVEIIDCGDPGPEGHILQWMIREKIGTNKPVKRFIDYSLTETSIIESMNNLRNASDYSKIVEGEFCKKKADWILGMSMSRCASIVYSAKIDVGRVQSPTLYFVVKRYLENLNFKPHDFFTLKAVLNNNVVLFWSEDSTLIFPNDKKDTKNRLVDKTLIGELSSALNKSVVKILDVMSKDERKSRPHLYDLSDLQKDANKYFNYSAATTLECAQELYETYKILSYPRTDSKYLTTAIEPNINNLIELISLIPEYKYACEKLREGGLNVDKHIINDVKVTDHHALIITQKIKGFDFSKLSAKSKNILHLVISRMLVALSCDYLYKSHTVLAEAQISYGTVPLSSKSFVPINLGFKALELLLIGKDDDGIELDTSNPFSSICPGMEINVHNTEVLNGKTTAPSFHTERTLLIEMESAGGDKGIGTVATRGGIIKSLIDKEYISYEKKSKIDYLIPTKTGINIIKVIPPELFSPSITANWEHKIKLIADGKYTTDKFMAEFEEFIKSKVEQVKANKIELDFSRHKEVVGKCPICKNDVIFSIFTKNNDGAKKESHVFHCNSKECHFSIQKDNPLFVSRTRRNLTSSQAVGLIEKGQIKAVCVSKNDAKYDGLFKLVLLPNGYAQLVFEFAPKPTKRK